MSLLSTLAAKVRDNSLEVCISKSNKIADNKGKNVINNRERLKSASESMVGNPGRRRQDSQDRSRRSRVTDREIRAE